MPPSRLRLIALSVAVLLSVGACRAQQTVTAGPEFRPFIADAIGAFDAGVGPSYDLLGRVRGVVERDGRTLEVVVTEIEFVGNVDSLRKRHQALRVWTLVGASPDSGLRSVSRSLQGHYLLDAVARGERVADGQRSIVRARGPFRFSIQGPASVALADAELIFQFEWPSNGQQSHASTYARTGRLWRAP